ncbi:hypothetical protein J6590_084590 [Homalodisca vitripennis]|nr:hypothetical protein J6590_084590 [Homalodisca vitripennis]
MAVSVRHRKRPVRAKKGMLTHFPTRHETARRKSRVESSENSDPPYLSLELIKITTGCPPSPTCTALVELNMECNVTPWASPHYSIITGLTSPLMVGLQAVRENSVL